MNKLLILLGLTLCGAASLSAQNTPGTERARKPVVHGKHGTREVTKAPSDTKHPVYYVTSVNATGSHLPVVVCRYQGRNTPMYQSSPGSGYGTDDVSATGALTVQGALRTLDPAISSTSRH